ncbi:MAG: glycosyltransferase family 4 protein [Gracilimonas sp.]|nr:glycosyltransferase family 4 protein [Gracilimonas sp.]
MHILMLLDHNYPPDQRVENEAESLVKRGFEVTVLAIGKDERPVRDNFDGTKIHRINMPISLRDKLRGLVGFFNIYGNILARYIIKVQKERQIDVIHIHDLYLAKAGVIAKKKLNVPLVLDLHENYVQALTQYAWSTRFPGKWLTSIEKWKRMEKEWIVKADKIISVIQEMKDRYLELGFAEDKIMVVPNTPNLNAFRAFPLKQQILNKFENRKVLLYSGGFDLHRGLESAIRAMKIVSETHPEALLVLVGDGRNKSELVELTEYEKLENFVQFEGWQDQENIRSYVKRADIGLIPHVKSVQTDASIPHKLGYYMSEALPVITSNCVSLERMVLDYEAGKVFESQNIKDLAEQIRYLLDHPKEAEKLGKNGKKAADSVFNWDNTVQPLVNYYKSLSD